MPSLPEQLQSPSSNHWDELAKKISRGQAILVLGPDAIPFYAADQAGREKESTFSKLGRERIIQKLEEEKLGFNFYKRDNLFQFHTPGAKHIAWNCIRDVAEDSNWLPDAELLCQIVQLPFAVILSLNPDTHLFDAFKQHWGVPQFDYFSVNNKKSVPAIAPPDKDNPLIYNLCGNLWIDRSSVVLDYSDLFEFLKKLLGDTGVPEDLTTKLRDPQADNFILLGFDLERWYFQLFLHYINGLDSKQNLNPNINFPILSHVGDDCAEFLFHQFNIKHIATTRDGFEQLFEACKKKGILRKLGTSSSPIQAQVRALVAQAKLEEAFALLASNLPEALQNVDVPQLQRRYNDLLREEKNGIISIENARLERNQISYTLLTFANKL